MEMTVGIVVDAVGTTEQKVREREEVQEREWIL